MNQFGNIILFYDPIDGLLPNIEAIISANSLRFERLDATFFVETASPGQSRNLVNALKPLALRMLFIFNNISDGDYIKGSNIPDDVIDRIESVLLD